LRIIKVQCVPVTLPIEPYTDAYGSYDDLRYALAIVHTDDGMTGVGEASPIDPSFYGETQDSMRSVIEEHIDPLIRGQDPLNIEKIESDIDRRIAGNSCAKTAIDIALYDLAGKALGVPVYKLLGGLFREKAAAGLELGIVAAEDMAGQVGRLIELEAKAVKIHVGGAPQEDIRSIRALRNAVGESVAIRADANGFYTTAEAIEVMRKVENCELEYFEQPVAKSNMDGLTAIRRSVSTPIAVDEGVWTPQDAIEICKRNAADIINIKLTRVGGLNKAKKIANIAEAAALKCHVGCELELGVGNAAKVHLAVSLANATCAAAGEFCSCVAGMRGSLRDNIVSDPVAIKHGFVEPINKAGLGVTLDEEKMKLYGKTHSL
jgi:L-alanine-DL-glutamate epimerase-like enolase superfamily enzyme